MRITRALTFFAVVLLCFSSFSQGNEAISSIWNSAYHRQFDFWVGEWDVNLRIQQQNGEWEDKVQSTAMIYRILDGRAILELWNENKFNQGIKGYSLRYFNEDKNKWELWLNWPGKNSSGSSTLEGSFRHGRGEFFSEYAKNDSVTVTQRYTFCDITPTSLRWDNASSEDGGKTWTEGNWIMEFSRKKELAPNFSQDEKPLTNDDGNRCDLSEFLFFDDWVGSWSGDIRTNTAGKWSKSEAKMDIYPLLDGCAIVIFMDYEENGERMKSFSLNSWNTYAAKYEEGILDNQSGSNFNIRYGDLDNNTLTMIDKDQSVKSVWKKDKSKLSWDFYEKDGNEWQHRKSAVVKL